MYLLDQDNVIKAGKSYFSYQKKNLKEWQIKSMKILVGVTNKMKSRIFHVALKDLNNERYPAKCQTVPQISQ